MNRRTVSALSLAALVALAAAAPSRAAPPAARAEARVVSADAPASAPVAAANTRADTTVAVMVDHAKIIRLPERTQTVIVGNPFIADVATQKNGVIVLTGKSYGVTNLIALDAGGAMLAESFISVQAPSDAVVTVQRGLDRESYSCTPACQPSLQLGDSKEYFSGIGGQAGQRNSFATAR